MTLYSIDEPVRKEVFSYIAGGDTNQHKFFWGKGVTPNKITYCLLFFLDAPQQFAESQFPDQGLNWSNGNERPES